CGLFRAYTGVAGEHLALDLQGDIARTEHNAAREQPIERHIIDEKDTGLRTQERILFCRCFGLRIDDLERLADLVFFPHRMFECDREGAVAEHDDGAACQSRRKAAALTATRLAPGGRAWAWARNCVKWGFSMLDLDSR